MFSVRGRSLRCSSIVKQDLSVSINFNDVVKFCIHDHVDGSCKGIGEVNFQPQVALFYTLKGVRSNPNKVFPLP